MSTHDSDSESIVSRRRVLAGTTTLALGGLGAALWPSERATAQVTMGTLEVSGDDATLSEPPSRIDVSVSGEWSVDSPTVPEQVKTTLQVHVNGQNGLVDDVAETAAFDQASGTFDLTADLLADHAEVTASTFMPGEAAESQTTDLLVRVVVGAIVNGELAAENFAEDTASVTITKDGMVVELGGSGGVNVVA